MAKLATVKLGWTRSPSADVVEQRIHVTINGNTTVSTVGTEDESWMIEVQANGSVQFRVEVMDDEGQVSSSVTYAFVLGDLEAPLPPTDLFHEVVAVRDVDD